MRGHQIVELTAMWIENVLEWSSVHYSSRFDSGETSRYMIVAKGLTVTNVWGNISILCYSQNQMVVESF